MATESQLVSNGWLYIAGYTGGMTGQLLTITNRYVSSLSFLLKRTGAGDYNYWFEIYRVSDQAVLASVAMGTYEDISTSGQWKTGTFASPVLINDEVRIVVRNTQAIGGSKYLSSAYQNTDVKAGEMFTRSASATPTWSNVATYDFAYSYEYTVVDVVADTATPHVTTEATTNIDKTTATGNGTVTVLGNPFATQHGHCWATFEFPQVSNPSVDKTENGAPSATGAYTSAITGLLPNTLYYIYAYITNALGNFYGKAAPTLTGSFVTLPDVPTVTTKLATYITTTSAMGNGSIDNIGGSAVTQHGVCWSTSANPTTADSHTSDGATGVGSFDSPMTGLTVNTLYHYRVYATNSTGTGYGDDKTFTTQAAIGVPLVSTQSCTAVEPTTATGHGTLIDIMGSAVTQHGHCWSTSINPTTADSKTTLGVKTAGTFLSYITGLTRGTKYYVRAYATNTQGTGYGNNVAVNAYVAGDVTGGYARNLEIVGEHLAYVSFTGKQRFILGDEA